MDKRLLSACFALPLVTGCAGLADLFSAAPAPLKKVHTQDAEAILLTMSMPKPKPAVSLGLGSRPTTAPQLLGAAAPAPAADPAASIAAATGAAPATLQPSVAIQAVTVAQADAARASALPPAPVISVERAPNLAVLPAIPRTSVEVPATREPLSFPDAPARAVATTKPAAQPAPAVQAAAAPEVLEADVVRTIDAWRAAWERGDASRYLNFYDASYKGDSRSRAEWEKQRAARLSNGAIKVAFYQVKVAVQPAADQADVRFIQAYSSGRHSDHGEKHIKLRREGEAWKIVQENWTPR